jgi:hypothetical protein
MANSEQSSSGVAEAYAGVKDLRGNIIGAKMRRG